MKKIWITISSALIFCGLIAGGVQSLPVQAATSELTTATLTMENGAAVRLAENSNGLRFSAEISQSEYNALAEAGAIFGALIIPNDVIGGDSAWLDKIQFAPEDCKASFTDTYSSDALMQVYNARCENVDEDDNVEICGSVVNFKNANLTRPYVGVVYVGIPTAWQDVTDEETGEVSRSVTEYEYRFSPWYNGDMSNNTRCMYYVAQRAIEKAETELAAAQDESAKTALQEKLDNMNAAYIDVCTLTGKKYGYYVTHHYVDGGGTDNYFTELQYGLLNQTATATVASAETVKEKLGSVDAAQYIYDTEKTKNNGVMLDEGKVYAAGLQTLHVYYKLKGTVEILSDLFAQENASQLYTGGTMELDENGNLVSTSTNQGSDIGDVIGSIFEGTGQKTVYLTAAFIYEMQRLGYTEISVNSISVEVSDSLNSWWNSITVTAVKLSGYLADTNETTYAVANNQTTEIQWDIRREITRIETTVEDGTTSYKYVYTDDYLNGVETIAEDVTMIAVAVDRNGDEAEYSTATWTLNGLAVS